MSSSKGWIGVDLDGTLAEYHGWKGILHIGKPIPAMVERVKGFLAAGKTVKIFTARWSEVAARDRFKYQLARWLEHEAGLPVLEVTNVKDFHMDELWDDRAVQVEKNTGKMIGYSTRAKVTP